MATLADFTPAARKKIHDLLSAHRGTASASPMTDPDLHASTAFSAREQGPFLDDVQDKDTSVRTDFPARGQGLFLDDVQGNPWSPVAAPSPGLARDTSPAFKQGTLWSPTATPDPQDGACGSQGSSHHDRRGFDRDRWALLRRMIPANQCRGNVRT